MAPSHSMSAKEVAQATSLLFQCSPPSGGEPVKIQVSQLSNFLKSVARSAPQQAEEVTISMAPCKIPGHDEILSSRPAGLPEPPLPPLPVKWPLAEAIAAPHQGAPPGVWWLPQDSWAPPQHSPQDDWQVTHAQWQMEQQNQMHMQNLEKLQHAHRFSGMVLAEVPLPACTEAEDEAEPFFDTWCIPEQYAAESTEEGGTASHNTSENEAASPCSNSSDGMCMGKELLALLQPACIPDVVLEPPPGLSLVSESILPKVPLRPPGLCLLSLQLAADADKSATAERSTRAGFPKLANMNLDMLGAPPGLASQSSPRCPSDADESETAEQQCHIQEPYHIQEMSQVSGGNDVADVSDDEVHQQSACNSPTAPCTTEQQDSWSDWLSEVPKEQAESTKVGPTHEAAVGAAGAEEYDPIQAMLDLDLQAMTEFEISNEPSQDADMWQDCAGRRKGKARKVLVSEPLTGPISEARAQQRPRKQRGAKVVVGPDANEVPETPQPEQEEQPHVEPRKPRKTKASSPEDDDLMLEKAHAKRRFFVVFAMGIVAMLFATQLLAQSYEVGSSSTVAVAPGTSKHAWTGIAPESTGTTWGGRNVASVLKNLESTAAAAIAPHVKAKAGKPKAAKQSRKKQRQQKKEAFEVLPELNRYYTDEARAWEHAQQQARGQ